MHGSLPTENKSFQKLRMSKSSIFKCLPRESFQTATPVRREILSSIQFSIVNVDGKGERSC
jgi:hypothetical protein